MISTEQLQLRSDSELRTSAKWRNLVFDKNGKSYRGVLLFNQKEEAERLLQDTLMDMSCAGMETMDGLLPINDYVWHMQMPVL